MIETYRDEFALFYDEENDGFLPINEEIDEDETLDSNEDELPSCDDEKTGSDSFLSLENNFPEDEHNDRFSEITSKTINSSLIRAIRFEMMKPEYNRNKFKFKYRSEEYSGIPLQKINEEKYIFLIDKKMKGIHLDEMILL